MSINFLYLWNHGNFLHEWNEIKEIEYKKIGKKRAIFLIMPHWRLGQNQASLFSLVYNLLLSRGNLATQIEPIFFVSSSKVAKISRLWAADVFLKKIIVNKNHSKPKWRTKNL
jgi:hypothetical protein